MTTNATSALLFDDALAIVRDVASRHRLEV